MINFNEKLNFLFELTQAEGKELAAALHITPPQISKMRKGIRGIPRDVESTYTIALFFAQRCKDDIQKESLSKAMNVAQVMAVTDESILAEMLLSWFQNEKPREYSSKINVNTMLRKLNSSSAARFNSHSSVSQPLRSIGNNISAYFGIPGKQTAYMVFLQYLLEKRKAFDICVLSDQDNTWIDDDPSFASYYYDHLLQLTDQGCFFRRIVGPLNNMEQAFYSLNRWLPLYITGKAMSYYYKRMRDNINRITIFVVSGVAALFSFSVGPVPNSNCVTYFTTDTKTVTSMYASFNDYLSMCDPAMNTYNADTAEVLMHNRLLEYESYAGNCIQLSNSLSFITLPWEIAVSLRTGKEAKSKDVFLTSFAKRYKAFTNNLEKYDFYDFIQLADIDEIISGTVSIPAANILGNKEQFYTPDNYLKHIKNIEYLLKHRNRYNVIIVPTHNSEEPIIYIKDDYAVLITRAETPFIIFDVSERNLMNAFTEYIHRKLPDNVLSKEYKDSVLKSIQLYIKEIEDRINSTPGQ